MEKNKRLSFAEVFEIKTLKVYKLRSAVSLKMSESCNHLLLLATEMFLQDYFSYSDSFSHPTCLPDNRYFHYTFSLSICSYRNHTAIDEVRKLLVELKRAC